MLETDPFLIWRGFLFVSINIEKIIVSRRTIHYMWKIMIFAGIGGFAGTCCRFLINKLCALLFNTPFPFATFIINITGCFLLGLLSGFFAKQGIVSPRLNAFLIVGFCGGFTTFSTFSLESLNLGISGLMSVSMLYIAASIVLGLLAVWCGMIITNH